jgi:hypothetical protein
MPPALDTLVTPPLVPQASEFRFNINIPPLPPLQGLPAVMVPPSCWPVSPPPTPVATCKPRVALTLLLIRAALLAALTPPLLLLLLLLKAAPAAPVAARIPSSLWAAARSKS